MGNAQADCQALLEKLYLFLDGELSAEECAALERHLDDCSACLRQVGFERELKELVRRTCAERAPEGLLERLRAHLHGERA